MLVELATVLVAISSPVSEVNNVVCAFPVVLSLQVLIYTNTKTLDLQDYIVPFMVIYPVTIQTCIRKRLDLNRFSVSLRAFISSLVGGRYKLSL